MNGEAGTTRSGTNTVGASEVVGSLEGLDDKVGDSVGLLVEGLRVGSSVDSVGATETVGLSVGCKVDG